MALLTICHDSVLSLLLAIPDVIPQDLARPGICP